MKQKKSLALIIILIVLLIAILTIFIRVVGLASSFKYSLIFLVVLLVSFGISVWLNRKWISYLPTFFFAALSIVFLVLLFISNPNQGDGFEGFLFVVFIVTSIMLSGISYLSAVLLDRIVINEETFKFQSLFIDYKEYVALAIGIIVLSNNVSIMIILSNVNSYDYLGITLVIVIIATLFLLLCFSIFLIGKKKIDLFKISCVVFIFYIPFSYVIQAMNRIYITMGVSLGLISIQVGLMIYAYNRAVKQNIEDKVEVAQ